MRNQMKKIIRKRNNRDKTGDLSKQTVFSCMDIGNQSDSPSVKSLRLKYVESSIAVLERP